MDINEMNLSKEEQEEALKRRAEKIAAEVTADFQRRREERRSVESGWLLNMNFLSGNQYCDVSPFGGVEQEDQRFYWQSRGVYNHIAPIIDSRLARLERLRPTLSVRAFSDEDGDLQAAKLATGVLKFVQERVGLNEIIAKATVWSETCGSVFYKVTWNERGGRKIAVDGEENPVYEGEVCVDAVSPFEIYPDRLNAESLDELQSLIHAQVVSPKYVLERFGVEVEKEDFSALSISGYSEASSARRPFESTGMQAITQKEGVILIERYQKPSVEFPKGRLEIVAGGKLLFEGELPFKNGEREERIFPFVKQDCLRLPAAFFSASVIERLIPVQRAYNAVRNRKHEFINRISMGVLTVEDGSVDADELSEDGLLPGKVLVYRQGGKAPEMLDCGKVPPEFADEEGWLEKEFSIISGVNDLTQNISSTNVTSATGLQLLLSRDDTRLINTLGSMESAMKEIARQVLRLYRQYAGSARLMTLTGENKKTQVYYFNASALQVNDLQFEQLESNDPTEKRETLLRLLNAGVLTDENGNIGEENKHRILDAFGFGNYENAKDISSMHIAKADEENLDLQREDTVVDDYDEHALHIKRHIRFLLSEQFKKSGKKDEIKKRVCAHIAEHRKALSKENKE